MKRALIIRLSSLGDVALSSVLFEPLFKAGYRTYLLTYRPYGSLFEDDPRVSVIETDKKELLSEENLRKLKELDFNVVIDIHRNIKTFLLKRRLKGRWVSYRKESIRRRLSVYFKRFRRQFYITEAYLKILEDLGIKGGDLRPKILLSESRLRTLQESLEIKNFVTVGVGARYRKKAYPHFDKVADMLKDMGYEVIYLGDEKDRKLAEGFPGLNLCGELSLTDVLAVLKLSRAFVGNDSGLLHCARAVGTSCVQIYGGTHPTLGFSLYPEEGKVVLKGLDCQPCDIHGKGRCKYGDYRCLEIDPVEIAGMVREIV